MKISPSIKTAPCSLVGVFELQILMDCLQEDFLTQPSSRLPSYEHRHPGVEVLR